MAAESLKIRLAALPQTSETREIRMLLQAMLDGMQAGFASLGAKLDADATVTDTNYAATVAAALAAVVID